MTITIETAWCETKDRKTNLHFQMNSNIDKCHKLNVCRSNIYQQSFTLVILINIYSLNLLILPYDILGEKVENNIKPQILIRTLQ